jgi:aspartate/methionine/tyrosine aminotransferase
LDGQKNKHEGEDRQMKIDLFAMERWQSEWEHVVDYNISESGVRALKLEEIATREELENLSQTKLGYIQTNGTPQLKEAISAYYPGARPENILVTTGSIEANFLLIWKLIEPGERALFMVPNFMQMYGLMRAFGARVATFSLREELGWNPDPNELKKLVKKDTKLIVVTNPNNPTGGQLSQESMRLIVELAEWAGAWIISDEVYQGAELDGKITPSFWGTYDKVLVSNGLSKAYGLPGLRVGWIIAPEGAARELWTHKDYTTIALSALSDRLARIVLAPERRQKIIARTRQIIRANLSIFESWVHGQGGLLRFVPPKAGAIAFACYSLHMNATELAHKIRVAKNVLIQPGDQFGLDRYIRFGLGEEKEYFIRALDRVADGLAELKKEI